MTNLDMRIGELRDQMEETYLCGDMEAALEISIRLDKLITLAQREGFALESMRFGKGKEQKGEGYRRIGV